VSQSGSGAGTVSYAHLGACEIEANQAASADGHYTPAQTVYQTVTVQLVSSTVTLAIPQATAFGQSAAVMATVSGADHSSPMGAVQFTLNGADLGSPVPVTGGTATSPSVTTGAAPGSYQVGATFEPAQATVYASASATPVTSVVQPGVDYCFASCSGEGDQRDGCAGRAGGGDADRVSHVLGWWQGCGFGFALGRDRDARFRGAGGRSAGRGGELRR